MKIFLFLYSDSWERVSVEDCDDKSAEQADLAKVDEVVMVDKAELGQTIRLVERLFRCLNCHLYLIKPFAFKIQSLFSST